MPRKVSFHSVNQHDECACPNASAVTAALGIVWLSTSFSALHGLHLTEEHPIAFQNLPKHNIYAAECLPHALMRRSLKAQAGCKVKVQLLLARPA